MKKSVFIFLLSALFLQTQAHISFNEAIKSNKINAIITGNNIANNPAKSNYRGKCLKIKITNKLNIPQEISIENAV